MDYVAEHLIGLGYSVERQDWSLGEYSGQNLVARRVGVLSPAEQIHLVAHVDGVQMGAEVRFQAADDDASGTVGNLEVARILSHYTFGRTVVLLFTTGEEQGALGARCYVDQLSSTGLSSIKYLVNVDMVGYDSDRDGAMELWSGDHPPSLALTHVMSETIGAYQLGLAPEFVTGCT